MVNRCVPHGEHFALARRWAGRLRTDAPLVIETLKRFADDGVVRSPSGQAARTRYQLSVVNDGADAREGQAAASEKRDPVWVGA